MRVTFLISLLLASVCLSIQSASGGNSENEIGDYNQFVEKKEPDFYQDIIGDDYFESREDEHTSRKKEQKYVHKNEEKNNNGGEPVIEEEIVTEKAPCLGCYSEINTEEEGVKELAKFAFDKFSTIEGDEEEEAAIVAKVVKALRQVVAGYKYMISLEAGPTNCTKSQYRNNAICEIDPKRETLFCDFEIIEQSWINRREILTSNCKRNTENYEEATTTFSPYQEDDYTSDDDKKKRKKREVKEDHKKVGGLRDAEESKDFLLDMAKFAVKQLDVIDDDNQARLVIEVLDAKKQTVSGWMYQLKVRTAHTTCEEGTEVTLERCKGKIILPFNVCHMKILFQPWQTVQRKVTESQCYPDKLKKSKKIAKKLFSDSDNYESYGKKLIGGLTTVDPESKEINEIVDFALEKVDAGSNALHAQKLVRVIEAQRQVINGIKTKILVEIGYTKCRKEKNLDKSKCVLDTEREHNYCTLSVWERPWKQEKKLTDSKCATQGEYLNKIKKREKREIKAEKLSLTGHKVEFADYLHAYGKKYDTEEEFNSRHEIYKKNMQKIKYLTETEQGTGIYGATVHSDMTEEEFAANHLGLRQDLKRNKQKRRIADIPDIKIPDEFDWRHYNVVTPVKNQGMCGSCWAFSVTGNIEGLYALKHKNLLSFSEQELVDCDKLDEGCNGGLPENAYKWIQKIGGLETEDEYPYDGKNEKCHFDAQQESAKVTGYVELPKNETAMAQWLLKNGPISIGINANAMQFYFGGVSHPWKFLCGHKSLDHGVLIVGFGVHKTAYTHKTIPYWIVKNSWGPGWGIGGYYWVYRGDGTCGVDQMATSAKIA